MLEAGQTDDIFIQIHDMKDSVDGRHIAKVHIPEKQRNLWNHYSSDKEDVAVVCRYCGYDRKHKTIENNAQRTDRNATRVRSGIILPQSVSHGGARTIFQNKRREKIRGINESNRMLKTSKTDTSDSSNDNFLSKSAAHMLIIETLKSVSCVDEEHETGACSLENENANRWGQHKQCKEEIALMPYALQRHSQEKEMKLE